MAASTTLITFMVRTPPTTLSVVLYGSWDNFTIPYPMSRDVRLGKEHWSGCHSFANIICDGKVDSPGRSRSGGLKMGGTYWYYYKLDDEIEFHNSAEPATTRCPLLPGQLVNELEVPVVLSGSRKREASVSSTSSEQRTLDPEDKFINPRPVPTPPKLMRLNTSPTACVIFPSEDISSNGPSSAAPLLQTVKDDMFRIASTRVFHLPRKPSLDALLKTRSNKSNPAGLRQAFKANHMDLPAIPNDKFQEIINWIPEGQIETITQENFEPDVVEFEAETSSISVTGNQPSQLKHLHGALLLRSKSDEAVPLASFSAHRRQKSKCGSRDTSRANSMIFDEAAHLDLGNHRGFDQGYLSALMEVNTPGFTPQHGPATGRRMTLEALEGRKDSGSLTEKRLPSLPQTPSSASLPTQSISPPRNQDSRFSVSTCETDNRIASVDVAQQHQDSSPTYGDSLIWSPLSASTIEDSICSPFLVDDFVLPALRPISANVSTLDDIWEDENRQQPHIRESILSCTTISSSVSTTPTTSCFESENIDSSTLSGLSNDHTDSVSRFSDTVSRCSDATSFSGVTSIRSSAIPYNTFQHYSLPDIENASEVTLKRFEPHEYTRRDTDNFQPEDQDDRRDSTVSHSDSMQQLLDELSYLSAMIQH